MTLTAEQLETRRQGLTATDMAKIVGMSPYGGAIDVLLDKQGVAAPFEETDRVKWGNILEGPIRLDYGERHGVYMWDPRDIGTIIHPVERWAMATPDSLVGDALRRTSVRRGWECKTHTVWLAGGYGAPGTDEVPKHELIQCAWNLYVARGVYGIDIDQWDLTAFIDGIPTDFTVMRDEELEEMLVNTGRTFWHEHVIGGVPLEPDGTKAYGDALKNRFPKSGSELLEADADMEAIIHAFKLQRAEKKQCETEEDRLVQTIKEFIGANAGVTFGDEKITWKKARDSDKTDWKAAFQELRGMHALMKAAFHRMNDSEHEPDDFQGEIDRVISRYTVTKAGSRRFVVPTQWNK